MPNRTKGTVLVVAAVVMVLAAARWSEAAPPPAPPAADNSPQRIRRLVQELGDKDYFVRQRAQTELAALGFEAFDVLSEATASEDPEVAARARYLVRLMRVEWADRDDPPEVKRLLQDYESQDSAQRQATMHRLAVLPAWSGIPALCRLVRYEKSAVLSKQAAIELLGVVKPGAEPEKEVAAAIRKVLDKSHRAAAGWLLSYASFGENLAAADGPWDKMIEAEESVLQASPEATTREIVVALVHVQVARLKKLGRNDDALAAMRRLIRLDNGDTETLVETLQWLIEQQAWKVVDEAADRFAAVIAGDAVLSYAVAEAQLAQGRKSRAEELAAQALKLNAGKEIHAVYGHFAAAMSLQKRGLFAWAEKEYRYIMAVNAAVMPLAAYRLAEMEHDQGDDLAAGEVLQTAVTAAAANRPAPNSPTPNPSASLPELRSQMDYFFACHWETKGDKVKARQHLEKALAENPSDIDVLIACYRCAGQTPEFHQKVVGLIRTEVQMAREKIDEEKENAAAYNQLAWLVANTEGDLDEALKDSQKSLEILREGNDRDTGGYYDTLGRVYFAKGDYQNAVTYQTKAAELEPHSGLIRRQLELFRKSLAEKTAEKKPKK
ncbi:MAG: tetratricopeptide repeat protein [Thermoguttaceae bacterium]